jgi:hydrogenase maturation factor
LLYDPQTSGGLLAVVAKDACDRVLTALERARVPAWTIGEVEEASGPAGSGRGARLPETVAVRLR